MKRLSKLVGLTGLLIFLWAMPSWGAPVVVEPGVTADIGLSPSAGTGETIVTRTIPIVNANVDATLNVNLSGTITAPGKTPIVLTGTFIATIPGARPNYGLSLNLPIGASLVPGSLTINGVVQPDPTIANNAYALTLNLPANSTTTVRDKVKVSPLP